MAGSLMLINPRKRRGSKRRTTAKRRRHNPIVAAAPRRRRRSHARRNNPIGLARVHHRRRRHARRHNPIGGMGDIGHMVVNGLKGAVGGVAVNAVANFMPAALKTGNVLYVTRAGLAIVLGTLGRKVGLGNHARAMAEGALAINFADLINSFAGGMLPGSHLHGMGAVPGVSYNEVGALIEGNTLGATEYVPTDDEAMIGQQYAR